MKSWIDISVPLHRDLPVWPGNPRFSTTWARSISRGDSTNDSLLTFDVHTGTHVEGLLHVDPYGSGPSQWPVDALVMDVQVVEVPPVLQVISEAEIPDTDASVYGLLFKTSNSYRRLWSTPHFDEDYCALNEQAAHAITHRPSIKAIGIDYLSIQSRGATIAVHQELLRNSVAVIEGLDLRSVPEGVYEMVCLPILIQDIEAAPCRVMLRAKSQETVVAAREVKSR